MKQIRRRRGWLTVLIVLAVIVVGLRVYGIDGTSLKIAWYRIRLLSKSPETGVAQVENLDALGPRGTSHLIWCVDHDLVEVQLAAIRVLAERREMKAGAALIRALDSPKAAVREAANDALEALSGLSVNFDPYAAWANRRDAVRQWEDWYAGQQVTASAFPG